MDEFKPLTREEYLLAKAGGIFEGEIPFSLATREEYLLNAIADRIGSGGGGAEPFVIHGGWDRDAQMIVLDKSYQEIYEASQNILNQLCYVVFDTSISIALESTGFPVLHYDGTDPSDSRKVVFSGIFTTNIESGRYVYELTVDTQNEYCELSHYKL